LREDDRVGDEAEVEDAVNEGDVDVPEEAGDDISNVAGI
jgi:hypothetical protein